MTEHESTQASEAEGQTAVPTAGEASHAGNEPLDPAKVFDSEQIRELEADDAKAGSVIGKMLALFFLYTVIVMSIVAWWTVQSLG